MKSPLDVSLNGDGIFQLLHLPDAMEKLLDQPQRAHLQDTKTMASSPMDVKESPTAYVFCADLPGLSSSDVKVQVENDNIMTIRGKRKREEMADEETKYIRLERRPVKFFRKFNLPADANVDAITACCKDGVLTVTVPKIPPPEPEKPKVLEIPVN